MAHAGQPGFARKHARRSAHAAGPISAVLPDTPHTMRADRSRQGFWVEKRRPGPERIGQALADPIRIGSRLCGMLGTKRSEEHTSELQSLMRISYAVFCLKKKKKIQQ